MNWKNYFIILVSFGIGLYVGWHPSNENVRTFISTIVLPFGFTGGGLAVMFKLMDWVEKWNTNKKAIKLNYSYTLVNKVLKPRVTTEIDFDTQNNYMLDIKIIGIPDTPEYKRYSFDADICLNEYREIKKSINDRTELIVKHNTKSQIFLEKLISDILKSITPIISTEWNSANPPDSKRFFVRTNIEPDIVKVIRSNYRTYEYFQLSISRDLPLKLSYKDGSTWVESDDKEQLIEIKKTIERKFNTAIKSDDFIQLKNCFKHIKEDIHEDYKNELNRIIINTVNKKNILKGIKV